MAKKEIKKDIDEERRYQVPTNPGNYPGDFINKVNTILGSNPVNSHDLSPLEEIYKPDSLHGIILAADMRNFTKTLESDNVTRVQSFLNEFFKETSNKIHLIDPEHAFTNKLLGDGLFAHVPSGEIQGVIHAARQMIFIFNTYKKTYQYKFANLSIAIIKSDYLMSTIGGRYLDYTLLGAKVNSLFRLLSRTEGGMIWVSKDVKDNIVGTHYLVYLGDQKYKGIVPKISCFSIIRKKTDYEILKHKFENECDDQCENFYQCKNAWEQGRQKAVEDQNEFIFELDCALCGPINNRCWHWDDCLPKYKHENKDPREATICCHVCRNFRNCFHSYQLGRQGDPMIFCDKSLYQTFI